MLLAGALGLAGPVRPLFVAAARGRVPAGQVLAALRDAAAPEGPAPGPYLGLVPFEERDARLFYGRDELADQLAERLHGGGMLLTDHGLPPARQLASPSGRHSSTRV